VLSRTDVLTYFEAVAAETARGVNRG